MIPLILILIYLLIVYILSIIIIPVIIIADKINKNNNVSYAIIKCVVKGIKLISLTSIDVKGLENVSKDTPVLFVANHNSLYDFVVTFLSSPVKVGYMAKAEILKTPLAKFYMDRINCTYVNRKDSKQSMAALVQTINNIKSGKNMLLFPEGTRNKGAETNLLDFKPGAQAIAKKAKCLIVPIAINNTRNILENHFPFIRKTKTTIEYLEPIDIIELEKDNENAEDYLKKIIENKVKENAGK